jgi:hypothetical protein
MLRCLCASDTGHRHGMHRRDRPSVLFRTVRVRTVRVPADVDDERSWLRSKIRTTRDPPAAQSSVGRLRCCVTRHASRATQHSAASRICFVASSFLRPTANAIRAKRRFRFRFSTWTRRSAADHVDRRACIALGRSSTLKRWCPDSRSCPDGPWTRPCRRNCAQIARSRSRCGHRPRRAERHAAVR